MTIFKRILTIAVLAMLNIAAVQAVQPVHQRKFVLPSSSGSATHVDAFNSTHVASAVGVKKAIMTDVKKSIVPDMIKYAKTHLGKRYVWGSMGPNTFDCSGLTSHVFGQFGIKLNRTSGAQFAQGRPLSPDEYEPGDLIFFGGRRGGSGIGHVGMVVEVDHAAGTLKFIHSSSVGVNIQSFPDGGYYSRRFKGVCRVLGDEERGE